MNSAGGTGVSWSNFPLDDGWIHMVYARSIATIGLPEYNPGQLESGMSSFVWPLFNAALYHPAKLIGLPDAMPAKILSSVFGGLCAWRVYRIGLGTSMGSGLAFCAGVGVLLLPGWAFSSASGMEVTFFGFMILTCLHGLVFNESNMLRYGLLFAVMARPEGLLLLLPVGIHLYREKLSPLHVLWPAFGALGLWAAYNIFVTGHPLPSTFYVKGQVDDLLRLPNLSRIFLFAQQSLSSFGLLASCIGLMLFVGRETWSLFLLPVAYLVSIGITHSIEQPGYYYWDRYLHPVLPFFSLGFAKSLHELNRISVRRNLVRIFRWSTVLAVSIHWVSGFSLQANQFSKNCRDVQFWNVDIGKFLGDMDDQTQWIASEDAGAIRYFSGRPVLDLIGLNDHELAHSDSDIWLGVLDSKIQRLSPSQYVLFSGDNADFAVNRYRLKTFRALENKLYSLCDCPQQRKLGIYVPGDVN
jgi:hypothetical protein